MKLLIHSYSSTVALEWISDFISHFMMNAITYACHRGGVILTKPQDTPLYWPFAWHLGVHVNMNVLTKSISRCIPDHKISYHDILRLFTGLLVPVMSARRHAPSGWTGNEQWLARHMISTVGFTNMSNEKRRQSARMMIFSIILSIELLTFYH